jgi:hypothetical protein
MVNLFEIMPYQGAGELRFGMSEEKVCSLYGRPGSEATNFLMERDLTFELFSSRFSKEDRTLVEIGFAPNANVYFRGVNLFQDSRAFQMLLAADGDPYESLGFIILLKIGITMTGFHDNDLSQLAVTLFTRGRWDRLRSKMKKFVI